MNKPLMPKATAVWLVENTTLTFDQIAEFCGLHILEIQAIADEEVAIGMQGLDPVGNGQVTKEEIQRCEADSNARLEIAKADIPMPTARSAGPRYTPLSKRQDKPDAIAWLLRHYPELSDAQIGRLIGTTKPTINAVRDRTHWNSPNLRPRSPVEIGLCNQEDLNNALEKAQKAAERKAAREAKAARATEKAAAAEGTAAPEAAPAEAPTETATESPAEALVGMPSEAPADPTETPPENPFAAPAEPSGDSVETPAEAPAEPAPEPSNDPAEPATPETPFGGTTWPPRE